MATMTEIEYLDRIDNELQRIFNMAATARDDAQLALGGRTNAQNNGCWSENWNCNERNWQRFANEPATTPTSGKKGRKNSERTNNVQLL